MEEKNKTPSVARTCHDDGISAGALSVGNINR